MELKDTIDEIGKAVKELRDDNDKRLKAIESKGYAPADLEERVNKINGEITKLSDMKHQLEAIETALARKDFPGGGSGEVNAAKAEHKKIFDRWFKKGGDIATVAAAMKDLEIKAELSTLSDPEGGYITAPPEVDSAIDRVAVDISAMRRIATVRQVGADAYKKYVNVGGTTSGWVGEKETRSETDTPELKEILINVQEVYAEPHTTQKELDDAIIDVAGWLADEVIIEFNDQEGEKFISGNGVKQPKGLGAYTMVTNANYAWGSVGYVPGGHASLFNNADKITSLQHALKPKYRANGLWLMNDTTCEVVRLFKNGNGDYLWRQGLVAGQPDTLLGKPIEYDDYVDDIGANKYPLFFGDFKRAYLIVDRLGIRIIRDNITTKGYVKFYTTKRVGGGIINYEAVKALKIATT